MADNEAFDFDGALKELIARKNIDPDKVLFDGKLELVREAFDAGVSIVDIFGLFKDAGFNGGREKLVRFMNEGGLQKKSKQPGAEKKKTYRRIAKRNDVNVKKVENVLNVPVAPVAASSGDGTMNILSDDILE